MTSRALLESGHRGTPPIPPSTSDHEIDLRDLWRAVYRQRWLVLGITVLAIGAGALLTWLQTPEYESEATVHIDQSAEGPGILGSLGPVAGLGPFAGMGGGSMATEIAVLQSRNIAAAVVDSLDLRVQLVEPAVPRADVLRVIDAPPDTAAGVYDFTLREDGRYAIQAVEDAPLPNSSVAALGEPIQLANTTLSLSPALEPDPPERIRIAVHPFRAATEGLRNSLSVSQADGAAQILSIRARSPDRVLAAAIPNVAASSYVEYKTRTNTADARSSVQFLREQVDHYAAELASAEAQLQRFSEEEEIVSLPDQASAQVRQVADFQAQRDLLITEREALQEVLAQVEDAPASATAPSPYRRLATFPTFLANGIVQNLVRSVTELETQRSELLVRFTPQHPDVQQLNDRIGELESELYQIATSYVGSLNSQIGSLGTMLARFSDELEAAPSRQIEYARLVRQQQLLEEIYTLLETRLKEAQIREAGEPLDVRVLDAALVPEAPVSPRPLLNLVLAAAVGLMSGLGVATVRAILDSKIRSKNDAVLAAGGAPVIGAIPRIWVAPSTNGKRLGNGAASGTAVTGPRHPPDAHLVTYQDPASPAAEAYRGLRTSVTLLNREHTPRVVVATSAMPGEGKSVSASNLAIALAQQGTRTLLVDADLRQGSLHRAFGISREPGLTDVLLGRATIEQAVREVATGEHGSALQVLTTGGMPSNPSELLGSETMRQLLERLRESHETVILDVPPLRPVTDATILGALADCTLLVVRAGTTHKRALAEAATELRRLNIPVGGVIVNDIDGSEMPDYQYGYGSVGAG